MEADDNKTDNRLSKPEVAYERTPKASAMRSRKTVDENGMEFPGRIFQGSDIEREEPWLRGFLEQLPDELERLDHPQPCTVEERRARIAAIQERIDAGDDKGISLDEFMRRASVLRRLYICG